MNNNETYVIYDTEVKKYIKIDMSSGGYPYEVVTLQQAEFFFDVNHALKYIRTMSGYSKNWVVKKIGIIEA